MYDFQEENYERFSENEPSNKCSRPSCVSIILLVLLTFVFLILPVIYLLHCFDLLHAQWKKNFMMDTHIHMNGEVIHVIYFTKKKSNYVYFSFITVRVREFMNY